MKSLKLLVFDISGEYGHFRKFNTTTSPLTYAIPTLPALAGMLGAIMGIERETAPNVFPENVIPVNEIFSREQAFFAIQIKNPIKKVNIGFNLLNTKSAASFFNIENRTQIEFELLKNARFRIFMGHEDEALMRELGDRIRARNHHFTPYLGLSQFTCLVEWIGETTAKLITNKEEYAPIETVLNLSKLEAINKPIEFSHNSFYTTDTMPMAMQRDRVVTEYAEVLMDRQGKTIKAKTDHYWQTEYGNILWL